MKHYVIDGGVIREEPSLLAWGRWFARADRAVAKTKLAQGVDVSTVFLGIDHGFVDGKPPVLWETMIFGGPHDGWQDRYTSVEEARKGHALAVRVAKGEIDDPYAGERHP
jgi:hypothetical protein